jgi:hypothetical protein
MVKGLTSISDTRRKRNQSKSKIFIDLKKTYITLFKVIFNPSELSGSDVRLIMK